MTTYTFPDVVPNTSEWSLDYNTAIHPSPLSGQVQTVELAGARWHCVLGFSNRSQSDMKTLTAFLTQLRGGANRFTAYSRANPLNPLSQVSGTPAVRVQALAGAAQFAIKNAPLSSTIFYVGDHFSINGELKMVIQNCGTDGAGEGTLTFEPPLRADANVDDTVDYGSSATAIFRLINDSIPITSRPGRFYNFIIEGIESF